MCGVGQGIHGGLIALTLLFQPGQRPQAYTRDSAFKLDKDGYLVTNTGANLMGYPTDKLGNPTSASIQALQLPTNAPGEKRTDQVKTKIAKQVSILQKEGSFFGQLNASSEASPASAR